MTSFDCLHDMGDPLGAARHIKQMLAPDGTWMVVEPHAGNSVTDNLNPVGRVYYSFSTFLCVPNALSQDGGYSLGAQAGEEPIRRLAADAGYTGFPPGGRDALQHRLRGPPIVAGPDGDTPRRPPWIVSRRLPRTRLRPCDAVG